MIQPLKRAARQLLSRTLYPVGSIARIRLGPARGLRYRIFPDYGLAPIFGRWEPALQRWFVRLVRPGMVVYDVGANYGMHSILLSRLVGAKGRVFAFEPDPDVVRALRDAIALNGQQNVQLVERALGDSTGRAHFARGENAAIGALQPQASAGFEVSVVRLDDFVFAEQNAAPQLLKLDVEGAEASVLEHGRRVLLETRPILLIELHTPEQDVRVGRALQQANYRALRTETGAPVTRLDEGWPNPDGVWGQIVALPN